MTFLEYGNASAPTILMIHGMGMTAEGSFGYALERLKDRYHILLACLDGYDDTGSTFPSIEDQAAKIAAYLAENHGGKIYAVLGMSMGGFIAIELLCKHPVKAEKLILDSGYMKPWKIAKPMAHIVANGFMKLKDGKADIFTKSGMKMVMGFCFRPEDLYSSATKETIYNSEYACLTYPLPDTSPLVGLEVSYWYGSKEPFMIGGMKRLKAMLPQMKTVCFGDYGHGEVMLLHPEKYVNTLMDELDR